jgi:DNA primase
MAHENVNYAEAVEILANKNGVTLEYTTTQTKKLDASVMRRINDFFVSQRSETLNDYLHKRGLNDQSIKTWEIGFAPSSVQTVRYINDNILDKEALVEFGVCGLKDDRLYSRFANRLMLPVHGNGEGIIGFNGRILESGEPKYLNSPQTKLFNKSAVLFGYTQARKSIFERGEVIITEGCFDVILMHQIGLTQTVATLGTSLNEQHLPKLRQSDVRVILAYDGDKAGINAAFKASSLLGKEGFLGGVVLFPRGLDPADMIKGGKEEEVKKLLSAPTSFITFVLDTIIKEYDISNPVAKEKALKACQLYVRTLSPLLQDEYALYLSKVLRIDQKHIQNQHGTITVEKPKKAENMAELAILKAMVLNEEAMNTVFELLDESCFESHQGLYKAVTTDDANIHRELACRSDIPSLSHIEFEHQVRLALIKRYIMYSKALQQSSLPHKIKRISAVGQRLFDLQRGKLIPWREI